MVVVTLVIYPPQLLCVFIGRRVVYRYFVRYCVADVAHVLNFEGRCVGVECVCHSREEDDVAEWDGELFGSSG